MANLSGILKQLKKERTRVQWQLSRLDAALRGKLSRKRRLSAKGRAKIAAAQRARWARIRGQQKKLF